MKANVTVNRAIKKGKYTVNLPAGLIMFSIFSLVLIGGVLYLQQVWYLQIPIFLLGCVLGFLAGWTYWSFAITSWRIWAFENVRNVHELKLKAIKNGLIHSDGSWAEKTEIRTSEQKQKLKQLERRFNEKDVYRDDLNVSKETAIFPSKKSAFIMQFLCAFFILMPIYRCYTSGDYRFLFMTLIGVFLIYVERSQSSGKEPQIYINSDGIKLFRKDFMSWEFITNETVNTEIGHSEKNYFLYFKFHNEENKVVMNNLSIDSEELEHLLQVYRLRFQKQTK